MVSYATQGEISAQDFLTFQKRSTGGHPPMAAQMTPAPPQNPLAQEAKMVHYATQGEISSQDFLAFQRRGIQPLAAQAV